MEVEHIHGVLVMQIRIPMEISRGRVDRIVFFPSDLNSTWMQFFKKYKQGLSMFLDPDKYIVHDSRKDPNRKYWSLDDTIMDYINSFKITLTMYRATIAKKTDKMVIGNTKVSEEVPPHEDFSDSQSIPVQLSTNNLIRLNPSSVADKAGSSDGVIFTVPSAPAKRLATRHDDDADANSGAAELPRTTDEEAGTEADSSLGTAPHPPVQHENSQNENFIAFDHDGAVSGANSVMGQDSDFHELINGEVEMIQPQVVSNVVKHLDNITLLRMKHELQSCLNSGKWLNTTWSLPITATALQMILELEGPLI